MNKKIIDKDNNGSNLCQNCENVIIKLYTLNGKEFCSDRCVQEYFNPEDIKNPPVEDLDNELVPEQEHSNICQICKDNEIRAKDKESGIRYCDNCKKNDICKSCEAIFDFKCPNTHCTIIFHAKRPDSGGNVCISCLELIKKGIQKHNENNN